MTGYDTSNSSSVAQEIELDGIDSQWTVEFGQNVFDLTPTLLTNDRGFLVGPDTLTIVARNDGAATESISLPGNIAGCPAIGEDQLFIPRDPVGRGFQSSDISSALLSIHDATDGREISTVPLNGRIAYSLCLDDEVFLQTSTGVYSVGAGGDLRWSREFQEDQSRYRYESLGHVRPLTDGDAVYALCPEGLCRFDRGSGEIQWRTRVPATRSAPALSEEGTVVATSHPGVKGINSGSGEVSWELEEQATFSPALSESTAILPLESGLRAVSTETGEELWDTDIVTLANDPLVIGEYVVASMTGGEIQILNRENGSSVTNWTVPGQIKAVIPGGDGLFVTEWNNRYRLRFYR